MALQVRDQPILSQGEFRALVAGLDPANRGSGVLQAWWLGEAVTPSAVYATLDVEARTDARSDEARAIIDRGLDRLERAFPEVRT